MESSVRTRYPNSYSEHQIFSVDKCYEFAYYTRSLNGRYFMTNPMQYVGRYVNSPRWGYGDNGGGTEVFNNNGTEVTITLDYTGREASNSNASAAVKSTIVTKPTVKDEDLCVICFEREKTHAFAPCGHMCVCEMCSNQIMSITDICPICRSNSSSVLHIYINT